MLTTAEAAARLGLKPVTLRKYIKDGAIKAMKHGRDWLISTDEIDRYQQERRPAHRPKKSPDIAP